MKRLNPDTGKPFVRGDTRADGFLFSQYVTNKSVKKDGYFREAWVRKATIEKVDDYKKGWNRSKGCDYRKANKDIVYARTKSWKKNNAEKVNAYNAKRHAAKLQRKPKWLTKEHYIQIESVYALAKRLTDETGVLHHVDHIVPLQGELVSGLHVPWNLRAIPATENLSKYNTF